MKKIVIIGGVAGGATAAARLRRLDEEAEITLLEKGEHISFANCGLPYYAGGVIEDREDLLLQTPGAFYHRFRVDVRVRNEAVSIHKDTQTVTVRKVDTGEEYTLPYDDLILAPGAQPVYPKSFPRGKGIFTLRNVQDVDRIKTYMDIARPRRALVVGGGFIGMEMVENLLERGIQVHLVEMAPQVLTILDWEMARMVEKHLQRKGVALHLGCSLRSLSGTGEEITAVLDDGEIGADMVVLAMGVRPDTEIAAAAGVQLNAKGGIMVDDHMATNIPHIYAVGDAVEISHFLTGEKTMIPLAGPANKQGRIAADNICGINSTYEGTQGSSVVKVFDLTVASTGLTEEMAKAAGIPYDKMYTYSASHATYYPGAQMMRIKTVFRTTDGAILGVQIVGGEGVDKRCDVFATAIRGKMTAEDLTELELCYAPPFGSAKDPVNMVGYAIENVLTGKVRQFHWHDVDALPRDGSVTLLDTRTAGEYAKGHIDGFVHIPLDNLRERLGELCRDKAVYLTCQVGLRGYLAARILSQNGFDVYNLSGGYSLYQLLQ